MKLTIVGNSGSMAGPVASASCYLVSANDGVRDWHMLLDLGAGAIGNLQNHVDPLAVDTVVFSHLHADHCADLAAMHVYRRWHPNSRGEVVDVYGPADVDRRLRQLADDPDDEDYSPEFDFTQVVPGEKIEVGPLVIEFFEAWHTVPAVAMRVTGPSERGDETVSLTYTGDTDLTADVIEAAHDVDLLLSEAAFEEGRDDVRGIHLTGRRAGELARKAEAKELLLTHIQPWTNTEVNVAHAAAAFGGPVRAVAVNEVIEL